MRLHDRTILITGASSGIGRELALQLANRGNRLILFSRRLTLLEELAQELHPHPLGHRLVACDVADLDQVGQVCKELRTHQIIPEVLLLNAGVGGGFNARQIDVADMRRQFDVNFWGVVNVLSYLLPTLVQQGRGWVAVTGSLAGYRGMPRSAPYSAGKAALARLVESLRIDLYDSGVRFTLITPGFVKTPMTDLNKYRMPFLMPVEKAVAIILSGLEKEKTEIHFPYRLSLLCKMGQWLPNGLYANLMSRRPQA